jgi:hypothetical protein
MTDKPDDNENETELQYHKIGHEWYVYYHLPFDTDWSLESYKKIFSFDTVEDALIILDEFNELTIQKCMIFIMKNTIQPTWEDPENRNGSCISFKIPYNNIYTTWKDTIMKIICNNISEKENMLDVINGISLSPKKKFSILKIWLNTTDIKSSDVFNKLNQLDHDNCIIKKHIES